MAGGNLKLERCGVYYKHWLGWLGLLELELALCSATVMRVGFRWVLRE